MIDFHTHTLMSDGVLLPTELARRAKVAGYSAIAITDHADESNIEDVIRNSVRVARELNRNKGIVVIPGVELTHIPPADIPGMVRKARDLGAAIVIGHGETLAEPVAPGTNLAYIRARADILAHPGLITGRECALAARNSVCLEITSRKGHSLSNGHVAALARKHGALMVVNSDSHEPGDLLSDSFARKVAEGAGLDGKEYGKILENAKAIVRKAGF